MLERFVKEEEMNFSISSKTALTEQLLGI
jgi:hypothetical protein